MTKLIAKIDKFEIRKTGEFNFVVFHEEQGRLGVFRTEARARDLIEMFTEE